MPSILIVDDDAIDRELASRCLEPIPDLETRFASDGTEAIEEIARRQPDLVLTDLRMPRMDGLELVEKIREENPLLAVVLMTAKGSERIAVQALEAGAASYVPKSDLKRDLIETVVQVLLVQEARRSKARVARCLSRSESRFELTNDPDLISPLVGFLQDNLERLGFGGESLRTHVGIALMEALSNAMIHGNLEVGSDLRRSNREMYDRLIEKRRRIAPYADRRLRCDVGETPDRVRYVVSDDGPGFDTASLPDPADPENLLEVSGRGIMLMCTFMDEVTYNDRGNEVILIKNKPNGTRES